MMKHAKAGFTLAELLIALALLGLVAAFTIPKIMMATGTAKTSAKVRDAISILEQAWYSIKMQGQIPANAQLYYLLMQNPNATSTINTIAATVGTPQTPVPGGCSEPGAPFGGVESYIELANGVIISGLGYASDAMVPTDFSSAIGQNNYIICIDTDPKATTHQDGVNLFYGNFNPTGSFADLITGNANSKNFYWGSAGSGIYPAGGGPTTSNVGAEAGQFLN